LPISDVRVTLTDGKAHSVDSSDAAFQISGALAIKDVALQAGLQVLEPIEEVGIVINDPQIGTVLSDLSGRRAKVTGTDPVDTDRPGSRSAIHAEVPSIELVRYAAVLRSLTGGAGSFTAVTCDTIQRPETSLTLSWQASKGIRRCEVPVLLAIASNVRILTDGAMRHPIGSHFQRRFSCTLWLVIMY
jgi:translation elongation factor EF-G